MNDEVKKQLEQLLIHMLDLAKQGENFVIEQAPLLAQEIIMYGRFSSTFWFGLGIVLFLSSLVFGKYIWGRWSHYVKLHYEEAESNPLTEAYNGSTVICFLSAIASHIFSVVIFVHLIFAYGDNVFKSWFAPRLYLVDYIRDHLL